MDRFHKFSILVLVLLSVSLGWEAFAIPAPSRNTTVEPGCVPGPFSYSIYIDGSTALACNGTTGKNDFSSTTITTTFQNAINSGGRIIFQDGTYNLGSAPTQINLVSNLELVYTTNAIIKVSSAGNTFNVFKGTSVVNITISGGQFDGTTGTKVSGTEGVNEYFFTGTVNSPSRAITIQNVNFRNISGTLVHFDHTNDINIINNLNTDPVTTGGLTGDMSYVSNLVVANNNLRIWDTAIGLLGSSNVTIANNLFQGQNTGQAIDLIQNTAVTDTDKDITIIGNQCLQFGTCVSIHDTSVCTTFTTIKILNNIVESFGGTSGTGSAVNSSTCNNIKNLDISGNTFEFGDKAIILSRIANSGASPQNVYNGVRITENRFATLGGQLCGTCSGFGIWNNNAATTFNDTLIALNTFSDIFTSGASFRDIDCDCQNSMIVNNKFIAGPRGMSAIYLQALNGGATTDNDVIQGNSFDQSAGSNDDINFLAATQLGGTGMSIENNPLWNPIGILTCCGHTNFISTTGGNFIGYCGGSTTIVSNTPYTVCVSGIYLTSSGGTGVSITIYDNKGNSFYSPGATLTVPFYLPRGYEINFGGFSVAPTLVIVAV